MLYIIAGDTKQYRTEQFALVAETVKGSEHIILDDVLITMNDLEQYLYPSLFTLLPPIVIVKFMLNTKQQLLSDQIKKIIASPTVFVFEDFALPAPIVTSFKKHGAIIYHEDKKAVQGNKVGKPDIFAVTAALTAANKKDRWLVYQSALEDHAVEAVIGILYWKVRDLIQKEKNQAVKKEWQQLYVKLMEAHATAWQKGVPLSLMIEKVLLG